MAWDKEGTWIDKYQVNVRFRLFFSAGISVTYLTLRSSIWGGLDRMALSPILVPVIFPTREVTSPVGSSRARFSMRERSACNTRLEF